MAGSKEAVIGTGGSNWANSRKAFEATRTALKKLKPIATSYLFTTRKDRYDY